MPHYTGRNKTIQDQVRIETENMARDMGIPRSSLRSCEEFMSEGKKHDNKNENDHDKDRENQHGNERENEHRNQQGNQHGNQQGNQQGNQHSNQQGNQQRNQHETDHRNQHENQQRNQQGNQHSNEHGNERRNEGENVHGGGSKVSEFQKQCGKKDMYECYMKEFNAQGNGSESESWMSRGCMQKSAKSSVQSYSGLNVHYCDDSLCNSSRFSGVGWLGFLIITLTAFSFTKLV
ncbi:hypothetical protein Avbf_12396 [Armadillidium vulgare]|nr:hypothetical protein Avbf_12396 [Armadillidium vulgare]